MNDMQFHASCAARQGAGVLLLGPPGAGKSDLLLRLLDHGFDLVADDQVVVEGGRASAPAALAGLLEVRGLGILRLSYVRSVQLSLSVRLGRAERLPGAEQEHGVPLVRLDPFHASAPSRIVAALRCVRGEADLLVGAFT